MFDSIWPGARSLVTVYLKGTRGSRRLRFDGIANPAGMFAAGRGILMWHTMARKRERFFALMGALFFLITASALSIAVIVAAVTSKNSDSSSSSAKTPTSQLAGTKLKNFTPTSAVPKLVIKDTTVGTGTAVKAGDTVTVDYTGAVAATGVIFQSSLDSGQPATFGLNGVIKGWTEGLPGMRVGGTRRLLIPADLAYGANPPTGSGIPANAPLVFDITLHSIGK